MLLKSECPKCKRPVLSHECLVAGKATKRFQRLDAKQYRFRGILVHHNCETSIIIFNRAGQQAVKAMSLK